MAPAPVFSDMKGESKVAGLRAMRSIASRRRSRPNSRTVRTRSVSAMPSRASCGRLISSFFAVQGMIEMNRSFLGSMPWVFANHDFAKEPKIACGERVVDKFGMSSGWSFSTKFTQPGQQLVIMGRTPFV